MKALILMALTLALSVNVDAEVEADPIAEELRRKVDAVNSVYQKRLDKIKKETIKRYKTRIKRKTRMGKIEEALDMAAKVKKLQQERDPCGANDKDADKREETPKTPRPGKRIDHHQPGKAAHWRKNEETRKTEPKEENPPPEEMPGVPGVPGL